MSGSSLQIKNLGLVSYESALSYMVDLHSKRVTNEASDTLLLLQHHPVITKGRRLNGMEIPNASQIRARGVVIAETDRGGLLTYHGPGQVVIYFILRVEDYFKGVTEMVHGIEEVLLKFLKKQNVIARTDPKHPGIWIGPQKIASIGLRVAGGVSRHGIAFNLTNDLSVYDLFDPCGLAGTTMTNLQDILQKKISLEHVWQIGQELVQNYRDAFEALKKNNSFSLSKRR